MLKFLNQYCKFLTWQMYSLKQISIYRVYNWLVMFKILIERRRWIVNDVYNIMHINKVRVILEDLRNTNQIQNVCILMA